jgi:hypothetical protein
MSIMIKIHQITWWGLGPTYLHKLLKLILTFKILVKGIVFKIILMDTGFSINLVPLRQVFEAGFTRNDLEPADIVISGFNNASQKALGTIKTQIPL